MNDHYSAAEAALQDAETAIAHLDLEHKREYPNKSRIAQLYDERNSAFNRAKIHAALAQVPASVPVLTPCPSLCLCGHEQDDHERGLGACEGESGPCGCPEFNL